MLHSSRLKRSKNESLILEALVEAGFPKDTTITQHVTGFHKAHPESKHNLLYRVVTPNSFDEKIVNEIDAIFGLRVKFEKMKGSKIIQCKRCQGYFHTASSCNHAFKCVKCNEDHDIGKCPRDKNTELPIRCVNCGGAHSVNKYVECKYFIDKIAPIINKKKGAQTQQNQQRPNRITKGALSAALTAANNITTGISYANALKGPPTSKTAIQTQINNTNKNVSVKPILTLDEKFDKFMEFHIKFQNHMVQICDNLAKSINSRK